VTRYYDLAAANERIAELRPVLAGLRDDRAIVAAAQRELERLRSGNGDIRAADGQLRADVAREQEAIRAAVARMEAAVRQVDAWGVTLRDIGSGLVDFPALASGRPIWLCWKLGEGDIGWWHELDTGIAGRRPLIDLE
jgi:hypothetical protein